MSTPENIPSKPRFPKWQIVIIIIVVLGIFNAFTGGSKGTSSPSSSSSSSQRVDSGTHMACEHWRINLGNASVETLDEQIKNAQQVNKYASVSTIPEIVSNARAMTEAFLKQDSEAYLTYGTAFGSACQAVGE
jgi:hypothetical protein